MTFQKNLRGFDTSLGICVTLTMTSESRVQVVAKGRLPRREVTIYLPESRPHKWASYIQEAITFIENGEKWAVRLNWENVKQFITMDDLKKIERSMVGIPFSVYNAPEFAHTTKLDCNALYNAKRREKSRAAHG